MNKERRSYRTDMEELLGFMSSHPTDRRLMYEHSVVSPMDLVQRERFLRLLAKEMNLGEAVACDALVFGYDEPDDRHVTKVGGLPFWLADKKWPVSSDGVPLEFLVQFNFCASWDILPKLPDEMLSVFVEYRDEVIQSCKCIWQPIDLDLPLVARKQIPKVKEPMVAAPAYAVACRINEYPHAKPLKNKIPIDDWATLTTIRGAKIGGVPHYFSDDPPKPEGKFICALHSLRHPVNIPWPFANVEEPLTPKMLGGIGLGGGAGCYDTVKFADQGTLYFFLSDEGRVQVKLQCWGMTELEPLG
jgi:hypothetical protein